MFPWGVSEQQGPVQGAWDYVLLRVWFNSLTHGIQSGAADNQPSFRHTCDGKHGKGKSNRHANVSVNSLFLV